MSITPFELEILMPHYISSAPFRNPDLPLYKQIINMWQDEGFIKIDSESGSMIGTTNKGKEFIERLLRTEKHLPELV